MAQRYKLSTDRLVNRLLPHYLAGRRFILLVQSLLYPLQSLNDRFVAFAREKHIEARMTSQVMYFEWYLNHLFGRYFHDPQQRITLSGSTTLGVDLYHEGADGARPYTVWYEGERITAEDASEQPRAMYLHAEEKLENKVSFMVSVPPVTISDQEMVSMLTYVVERYRTAGKTYLIRLASSTETIRNKLSL